jgi:transposase
MTETSSIFPDGTTPTNANDQSAASDSVPKAAARVLMPDRSQVVLRASSLESLLPQGHRARMVWGYVERQNMAGLYAGIKAVEGGPGRPAIAPEILFALWLFATLEGVGSARSLDQLTGEDDAYRWICGGVDVNYHTLADFRHEVEAMDELLTDSIASLMAAGAVKLKAVAQDGMRVRASAGAASFRREDKLKEHLETARKRVAQLKAHVDDPVGESHRKQAAQRRAAEEREAHIEAALARLPELAAIKKNQGKKPEDARSSTTDAEATVMKMADGGFRPAFNFQYASDTESQVIVGVEVITSGSDQGYMAPMVAQVSERCGQAPESWLVDGGYPGHDQIDAVSEQTTVYAPVPESKNPKTDIHKPKADDSPAVGKWRERMGTDEAKVLYKERAATAECVNAQARNRDLNRLLVRGLEKVRGIALLFALAHNLMRAATLVPELVGIGTGMSAVPQMAG